MPSFIGTKFIVAAASAIAAATPTPASAQADTFADWVIVSATDGTRDVIAGTFTDGGEILAYRCAYSDGRCTYGLMPNTTCEQGGEYPMLVNAEGGSALVSGICVTVGGKFQYLLRPYKPVEDALKGGVGMVGFAMPMKSGAFKAVRFSVRGGALAIQEAERRIVEQRQSGGAIIDNSSRPRATTF